MKTHANVTSEVDASRRDRRTAAFFDFDGTLLAGFSVFYFLLRRYFSGKVSAGESVEQLLATASYALGRADFSALLEEFTASMAGTSDREMRALAAEVFRKDLVSGLYPEVRALLKAHQDKGHTVVILSSATQYQLELVAQELGVEHVVCTRLEVKNGVLTGATDGPACYGKEKYLAAKAFARNSSLVLGRSFFYTDGAEDIPLLDAVGYPRPTNPDSKLLSYAQERGWPVQKFSSRGIPGIADLVRTGLVYGSLLPSFLLGAPAWLLNRSRRDVVNLGVSTWADFGGAVAGLKLRIRGEEHVWTHRPAVFIFNHQSAADVLILGRLLRRDFTGLAKQEMKQNPLLGPAMTFADVVFIDRKLNEKDKNKRSASEAMQPALEKLEQGISIAVAPEGQRSLAYQLGPFRKGAFHVAMQAGVPIVPIVIANSSDALPKSALCIRPATVDVTVLPPVSTEHWTAANLDDQVLDIRELFLQELGQSSLPAKR